MTASAPASLLIRIARNRIAMATPLPADPQILLAGDPRFRTSVQDRSDDGMIQIGVWEATEGMTRSIKGEKTEFCFIISGKAELTQDGCEPQIFREGDAFVMKPGFTGTWQTLETVQKFFVIVDPGQAGGVTSGVQANPED